MRIALRSVILLLGAGVMPLAATADGLTLFNIQGSLQSGGSASGTISVSPAGQIVDVNISVTDIGSTYQFGGYKAGGLNPGLFEVFSDNKANSEPDYLTLSFSQTNLTGYMGGPLCSVSYYCPAPQSGAAGDQSSLTLNFGYTDDPKFHSVTDNFSSVTASVPSVPEPGTLLLVGTGMLGVLSAARSRFGRPPQNP